MDDASLWLWMIFLERLIHPRQFERGLALRQHTHAPTTLVSASSQVGLRPRHVNPPALARNGVLASGRCSVTLILHTAVATQAARIKVLRSALEVISLFFLCAGTPEDEEEVQEKEKEEKKEDDDVRAVRET